MVWVEEAEVPREGIGFANGGPLRGAEHPTSNIQHPTSNVSVQYHHARSMLRRCQRNSNMFPSCG